MRYMIFGDSWGCGEWGKEFLHSKENPGPDWFPSNETNNWHRSFVVPDTDIGTYLRAAGHEANNICVGGDSNINQLRMLEQHLSEDAAYDHIVWFHTEPIRDWQRGNYPLEEDFYKERLPHPQGYDEVIRTWFRLTYDIAESIYQKHAIPFTVIGGMTALPNMIHDYSFVHRYIKDWANEQILAQYCDHPDNVGQFNVFAERYLDIMDVDRSLQEAEASNKWIQACYMDPSFPDWGHPDRKCHEELSKWLTNI